MALRSEKTKSSVKTGEVVSLVAGFGYEVPDPDEVGQYLLEHLDVIPILQEATREIPHFFPLEAHRVLRVFHDQEWGDFGPLFVVIEWPRDASSDAGNRLDRFENEWWIPKAIASSMGSQLVFDVA
ncbi:hypothetical protein BH09CHL1_BH09CHL1_14790 [soil metagenome]